VESGEALFFFPQSLVVRAEKMAAFSFGRIRPARSGFGEASVGQLTYMTGRGAVGMPLLSTSA
jgi:hypothetical protein